MVATALCAIAATEASAQDGGLVLNEQLNLGDIIVGERLNVIDTSAQVSSSVTAQGNSLIGATEGENIRVQSQQEMQGAARARSDMSLGGQTDGVVVSTVQARGNYLAGTANNARMQIEAQQTTTGAVNAQTFITGDDALLAGGAVIATGAIANTVALSGSGTASDRAAVVGTIDQSASGPVFASTRGSPRWVRDPSDFSAQAIGNAVQSTTGPNSNQELAIRQRTNGERIEADVGLYAGNGWDLVARANATANTVSVYNQGGSLITTTDQANSSAVYAEAELSSYDFGKATAVATSTGNEVIVGNNDIYLEIDNSQLNSGGVEATANFTGQNGYDAYVGANAVGNSVTGFVCGDCGGNVNITNQQVNSGNVTATATTVINGSGRHIITGTTATGNAATFYATRPGG